jgi:hypothetical protein
MGAAPRAAAPPPQSAPRGDLLSAIRGGANLRKVDPNEQREDEVAPPEADGLAATLARAMEARRMAIKEGGAEDEAGDDEGDWDGKFQQREREYPVDCFFSFSFLS